MKLIKKIILAAILIVSNYGYSQSNIVNPIETSDLNLINTNTNLTIKISKEGTSETDVLPATNIHSYFNYLSFGIYNVEIFNEENELKMKYKFIKN